MCCHLVSFRDLFADKGEKDSQRQSRHVLSSVLSVGGQL